MKTGKIEQALCLLTCLLLLVAMAARRDAKLWGQSLKPQAAAKAQQGDTVATKADGTMVVNTAPLAKDVKGYGGNVPLYIYVKDGKITNIEAQPNSETPDFFNQAKALFARWQGKTADEAARMEVDGVSGATFSSKAIIANVKRGAAFAAKSKASGGTGGMSAKEIAALVVVALGMAVPLKWHGRKVRTALQAANVVVLGLWCGTFLSFDKMLGTVSGGLAWPAGAAVLLMAVAAFVYPLFGKKNYYCSHICPCGALQDLAGRCSKRKLKMSGRTVKMLTNLRLALFAALTLLMLAGVWSEWTGYELFTAFIFESAPIGVIVAAVAMAALAVFVPRPYCRFVCPTGTLLKMSEGK